MTTATDKAPLTREQISQFHRDGYLIVENLLTHEEADAFIAYEQKPKPENWLKNLRHHTHDEQWRALATNPRVTAIIAQLLEAEPMIVQSMYLPKPPVGEAGNVGGEGTAMHQDLHYLPADPPKLLACWMALNDTDGGNGGLCVVPGSNHDDLHGTHKNENTEEHAAWEVEYLMRDRDGKEWTEKMYSFEIDGLNHDDVERLAVPKGAGVFFDGKTIHGSYGNRSKDRYRHAFAVHYVPEGTWVFRDDVQDLTPAT